mmetsp:Transcript_44599/g.129065  ORF Transcript_44599/g.129065 Transcript_44599/m.129065 type:complete len:95 (-) Transcript_44599:1204-1488(-)
MGKGVRALLRAGGRRPRGGRQRQALSEARRRQVGLWLLLLRRRAERHAQGAQPQRRRDLLARRPHYRCLQGLRPGRRRQAQQLGDEGLCRLHGL